MTTKSNLCDIHFVSKATKEVNKLFSEPDTYRDKNQQQSQFEPSSNNPVSRYFLPSQNPKQNAHLVSVAVSFRLNLKKSTCPEAPTTASSRSFPSALSFTFVTAYGSESTAGSTSACFARSKNLAVRTLQEEEGRKSMENYPGDAVKGPGSLGPGCMAGKQL